MAYNYFPMNYQPMYYQQNQPQQQVQPNAQPQQQMSYAQPVQQSGIVWVQGEAGAKAYPVAPGSNMLLMDSESECFYIKSTDMSGMPQPLRVFEYKEVVATQPAQQSHAALPDMSQYVRKDEFDTLKKKFDELKKEMEEDGEQSI